MDCVFVPVGDPFKNHWYVIPVMEEVSVLPAIEHSVPVCEMVTGGGVVTTTDIEFEPPQVETLTTHVLLPGLLVPCH